MVYLLNHVVSCAVQKGLRINRFNAVSCNLGPVPVAARSKAWVCGRSFAGIAGSNLAGGMDIYVL
jgi:hypothetical protein